MKWTTTPPATRGWYWVRNPRKANTMMVTEIIAGPFGQLEAHFQGEYCALSELVPTMEWSDEQIPVPSE